MKNTNVYIEFNIIGNEFDEKEISNLLKIKSSSFRKKGELIGKTDRIRDFSLWTYKTATEETLNTRQLTLDFINFLKTRKEILLRLKTQYDFEYNLCIVIEMENKQTPGLSFNLETLNFLVEIGAEICVDMYIM